MGLELLALMALGFVSAILAYLLGIGGGALIVPALVVFYGFSVHQAIAVSLVVIVASSISIASVNLKKGMVNVRLGVFLESFTVVGAVVGGFVSVSASGTAVSVLFALVMVVTAYIMWKKSETVDNSMAEQPADAAEMDSSYFDSQRGETRYYRVVKPEKTLVYSFMAGLFSGMLGIGGGVLKVPAINIISKVPIRAATATSNFMICFTAAAGSLPYLMKGYFDPAAAGAMVLGVFAGSTFATGRLAKVQNKNIKRLFILFLLFVALQMVYKAVTG